MKLTECATKTCTLYAAPSSDFCWQCQLLGREKPIPVNDNPYGFKTQIELFRYCWETKMKRCFVSGQKLDRFDGGPLFISMFAHILRKSSFKEWRLNPNNIVLLSPHYKGYSIHHLFDNGSLDEILKFEEKTGKSFQDLFEFERSCIQRYNQEFRKHMPERKLIEMYMQKKASQ